MSMSFYVTTTGGSSGWVSTTPPAEWWPGTTQSPDSRIYTGKRMEHPECGVSGIVAGRYLLAGLPAIEQQPGVQTASGGSARYYGYTYGPLPATFSTAPQSAVYTWSFYATVQTTTTPRPSPPSAFHPSSASVAVNGTQQFTATAKDQSGNTLSSQPSFTWTVNGGGTITSSGLFTAGSTAGGPYTVTASSGGVNVTASVTVSGSQLLYDRTNEHPHTRQQRGWQFAGCPAGEP